MRTLILVLALLSGCAKYYPGNGPLVNVQLDGDGLKTDPQSVMLLTEWFNEGAHAWDSLGAQFRVGAPNADYTLPLHYSEMPWYYTESCTGSCVGVYMEDIGEIWMRPSQLGEHTQIVNVSAHEIGHAMGLHHTADGIMAPWMNTWTTPKRDDIAEYHRVYGP